MGFYIIAFTSAGIRLGMQMEQIKKKEQLEEVQLFGWHKYVNNETSKNIDSSSIPFYSTKELIAKIWKRENVLLFIGAAGIAVRSIAPFIIDKTRDPAVLVMDDTKKFVISLLSGHLGGANEYCEQLAEQIGAIPVITTATDRNQCFAVDLFAKKNGLWITDWHMIKEISASILEGKSVGLVSEYKIEGNLPTGLTLNLEGVGGQSKEVGIVIAENIGPTYFAKECRLLPKNLVVGIGCRKGKRLEELELFLEQIFEKYGIMKERVQSFVSIDRKKEEPAILALSKKWEVPFRTYTAQELSEVKGLFSESDFVRQTVGVANVCERSACLGSHYGKKRISKQMRDGMTVAVYEQKIEILF